MRPNLTKEVAKSGKPALGMMANVASPLLAEALGHSGYDFLIVDMQHGETDMHTIQAMLQAVSATPATPLVRVPANLPVYIQRILDFGAYGLIVPMVNTPGEAAAAVEAVRFPPKGNRSFGPFRASIYGGGDYFAKSASELLTLVMLETAQGVANAEEILDIDGVDGCFIGPGDLNISLGFTPDTLPVLAPETETAIAKILTAAKTKGKIAGIQTFSFDDARKRIAQGFHLVSVLTDLRMLRAQVAEAAKAMRAAAGR